VPSKIRNEIDAYIKKITCNEQENKFSAQFAFPSSFIGFKGHFPDNPILPGLCQIQCILVLLSRVLKKNIILNSIKKIRFLNTVLPGEIILLSGSAELQGEQLEARFQITKKHDGKEINISRLHIHCHIINEENCAN